MKTLTTVLELIAGVTRLLGSLGNGSPITSAL
jgi:hypothetical protein